MRIRAAFYRAFLGSLLALTLLTGCGDNRPLNYRALVLTLGFSPAPHQRITAYFQIPTPSGLTSLSTGGSASGASSTGATTYTLHATASTVARAFTRAQADVNQDLYLGQLQAVILSTHLTATQFADVASTLTRLGTVDKTADALATPAPMASFFTTKSASTPLSPLYFATEFGCTHCQVVNLKREIWNVEQAQYGPPILSLWLPLVSTATHGFHIDTMALYRDGAVARQLTAQQTTLLGYTLGRTGKGTVHLIWDGLPVSVRALRAHAHVTSRWRGSTLVVHVALSLVGNVDAFPVDTPLAPHLAWLRKATSARIAGETLALATKLAHQGLDPWTIGAAEAWHHPGAITAWQRAYRHARWVVTVQVHLRELGDST